MPVIKGILIFFTIMYTLDKMVDGESDKYTTAKDRIINLIEIVVSIALTFIIFKI